MLVTELKAQIKCLAVLGEVAKQMEQITGRVFIQKTLYLLKQCKLDELRRAHFAYHHYGPFSNMVAECLADAVDEKVLHEERKSFASKEGDERLLYRYTPGPNVDEYALDVGEPSRQLIREVLARVKDEYWRTLELAATIHYLEHNKRLARNAACGWAIELKPPASPIARKP